MSANKVVVFGLDGGSLDLVLQWLDYLPTFRKILSTGHAQTMTSTVPVLTSPAWVSMFTGKNPAELGIYDFLHLDGSFKPHNSLEWAKDAIWTKASASGLRCNVVNVPGSYPPHIINGNLITGIPHNFNAGYTYPLELEYALEGINYEILPPVLMNIQGKEEEYREELLENLRTRRKAIRLLLNTDWDLFIFTEFITDVAQHYFWKDMDTAHPKHVDSFFGSTILDVYIGLDLILKDIYSAYPEASYFIVSDHSFQPCHEILPLNAWLIEKGYLTLKKNVSEETVLSGIRDRAIAHVNTDIVRAIKNNLPSGLADRFSYFTQAGMSMEELYKNIEWDETAAYALGICGNIFVKKDCMTYAKVAQSILRDLRRDFPELMTRCKAEVFSGKYLGLAPDICVLPNKLYATASINPKNYEGSGTHELNAMCISNTKEKIRSIYDIYPALVKELGI